MELNVHETMVLIQAMGLSVTSAAMYGFWNWLKKWTCDSMLLLHMGVDLKEHALAGVRAYETLKRARALLYPCTRCVLRGSR